jgi:hypothetical protein
MSDAAALLGRLDAFRDAGVLADEKAWRPQHRRNGSKDGAPGDTRTGKPDGR